MKDEKMEVENRGMFSAAPEDWGALYSQALDSLEMDIPLDMTDRILAGLGDAEQENGEFLSEVPAGSTEKTPVLRDLPGGLARRGKVITAAFGKYAASIAACFVLAVGVFTMNSEAGQQILRPGSGDGMSLTSEIPVKAASEAVPADRGIRPAGSSERKIPEQDSADGNSDVTVPGEASVKPDTVDRTETATPQSEPKAVSEAPDAAQGNSDAAEALSDAPVPLAQPGGTARTGGTGASSGNTSSDGTAGTGRVISSAPPVQSSAGSSSESDPSPESGDISSVSPETESGPSEEVRTGIQDERENLQTPEPQQQTEASDPDPGPSYVFDSTRPVKELDETDQLPEVMGYQPKLVSPVPEGWTVSSIEVIWGITAQITYTNGDDAVLYRTSAGASILNSESGSYEYRKQHGIYTLEGGSEDQISLVTWTAGGSSFSMTFNKPVGEPQALEWAGSVV